MFSQYENINCMGKNSLSVRYNAQIWQKFLSEVFKLNKTITIRRVRARGLVNILITYSKLIGHLVPHSYYHYFLWPLNGGIFKSYHEDM